MTVKKGLSIFLLLSIAMSGFILCLSVDRTSWDVFREADGWKMAIAALFVVAVWILDATKLSLLSRAAGERISPRLAIELTLINYFGAAITPMQSGGGPFQMYMMYKNGICVGKTFAITLVRTILTLMILGLTIPFGFMLQTDLPKMGWGMTGFVFYVVLFCLAVWVLVVVSIMRPKLIKRMFGAIVVGLEKIGILKKERIARIIKRLNREIDVYRQNLCDFMTTGRVYFIVSVVLTALQLLAQLSIMPCMIWALGLPVMYVECVLIQALFIFLLYFIPTPGASGAAEGGAAFVFSLFVPWNVAGMLGVSWRFLTEYTGMLLGTMVALKTIGWGLVNRLADRGERSMDEPCEKGCPSEIGRAHV